MSMWPQTDRHPHTQTNARDQYTLYLKKRIPPNHQR